MIPQPLQFAIKARVGQLHLDVALESGPGPLVVVGPNGSGKTTLLTVILGAFPVDKGFVRVGRTVLHDTSLGIVVPVEGRRIGYVPQDYALFPHRTVRGNVEFALASAGHALEPIDRADHVALLLGELGLEPLTERSVQTLSGGEKQRLALARALSVHPRALLLDEPLAALDIHSRREVRTFLTGYFARLGIPTVIVTHDAADARALGHRIAVLEDGRISQVGSWAELVSQPATRFVEEFVRHG